MRNTLLDASDKIDSVLRLVYSDVAQACAAIGVDYLVVGAAARDLVLQYVYGAPSRRATTDIDFGIKVAGWRSFHELRTALLERRYADSGSQHRLIAPSGIAVDIVPFGAVADADANIAWPPDGAMRMSVLGFNEAHDHSDLIRIQSDPEIRLRVATPVGMALLKLIAWRERSADMRTKDALDFQHLLGSYGRIPEARDAIYADATLGERHDWDVDLMSAEILGRRTRQIAEHQTADAILALAGHAKTLESLAWEMTGGVDRQAHRSEQLLSAFVDGFRAR